MVFDDISPIVAAAADDDDADVAMTIKPNVYQPRGCAYLCSTVQLMIIRIMMNKLQVMMMMTMTWWQLVKQPELSGCQPCVHIFEDLRRLCSTYMVVDQHTHTHIYKYKDI